MTDRHQPGRSPWLAYNELAWTDALLVDPADCESEVLGFVAALREASPHNLQSLLHLGSGAGAYDRVFKRYFSVTGVDASPGMLALARASNPEVEYIEGDMRTLRLGRVFDAVVIPDSIDYMVTRDDLDAALHTAALHLRPGGAVLVVAKPAETFRDNNFAYVGERDGVHVTLLENNRVDPARPGCYEATLVYLVRRDGELSIYTDRHLLGLFARRAWDKAFAAAGLDVDAVPLEGAYDQYLLGDGYYPQTIFVGGKRE
jgi:SAM-dependent methyltransferase